MYKLVNWNDENLQQFYGDNNNGLIYGIYFYGDSEDFPIAVEWFDSEDSRLSNLLRG